MLRKVNTGKGKDATVYMLLLALRKVSMLKEKEKYSKFNVIGPSTHA